MNWRHATCMMIVVAGLSGLALAAPEPVYTGPTTHEFAAHVKVRSEDGKTALATLCVDAKGRLYALSSSRVISAGGGASSQVQAFSPTGEPVASWRVDFAAQAINADAQGVVYVAGSGKVARFDADGKPLGAVMELPYVAELFKDKDALRKLAEEQKKKEAEQMAASLKQMRVQYESMIKKLEAKPEADRTKAETRRLEQYRQVLKSYDEIDNEQRGRTVDVILSQMNSRAKTITSIAANGRDVFVVSGEVTGWGYAVWRLDRDLANPTQIVKGLMGCCGQMDLQIQGDDVLVAENTRHQFTRYNRDGKPAGQYGKRDEKDPSGFAGCCNPMNLRACGDDIYTAESEGLIKRFTSQGRFVEVVGSVKLSGGCKHVAVATSPDASRIYFCDLPGSQIVILSRKAAK